MIKRNLTAFLVRYAREFPVLVVLGPRQVGKTTLVKKLSKTLKKKSHYLDLERDSDLTVLNNDAELYLGQFADECVIIDEIQRMPQLFPLLRALVDHRRVAARFVITGSASPDLLKGASESLAGRVVYAQLNPVGLHELPARYSVRRHWLRGGFPKALTIRANHLFYVWMDTFITTYIEKDLPLLFDVRLSPQLMRKLWGMLSHLHGELLNVEKLAGSLGIGATTVRRYLEYLEGAFLLLRLQPYHVNVGKRLVKAPKVYFTDSGILHRLLRVHSEKELLSHPSAGSSWEGYCISQIVFAAPPRVDAYFYRTHHGSECDLVLVHGSTVIACIEIKLGLLPVPSRGFYNAIRDLGCKHNFIIGGGDREYKTREGIQVTGLRSFVTRYLPRL